MAIAIVAIWLLVAGAAGLWIWQGLFAQGAAHMPDTRITFRKVATGAACGLLGFVSGGMVARAAVRHFAASPAWELPAAVCSALALLVVAVLIVAPALGAKAVKRN